MQYKCINIYIFFLFLFISHLKFSIALLARIAFWRDVTAAILVFLT